MREKERIRQSLIKELEKVNNRLKILDLIDEKLLKMKGLASRVVDQDLSDKEIKKINRQVKKLASQVNLLDREATDLS